MLLSDCLRLSRLASSWTAHRVGTCEPRSLVPEQMVSSSTGAARRGLIAQEMGGEKAEIMFRAIIASGPGGPTAAAGRPTGSMMAELPDPGVVPAPRVIQLVQRGKSIVADLPARDVLGLRAYSIGGNSPYRGPYRGHLPRGVPTQLTSL